MTEAGLNENDQHNREWMAATESKQGGGTHHCFEWEEEEEEEEEREENGLVGELLSHGPPLQRELLGLKKKRPLPGGESNPGLPRDRRRYSPLYYRG